MFPMYLAVLLALVLCLTHVNAFTVSTYPVLVRQKMTTFVKSMSRLYSDDQKRNSRKVPMSLSMQLGRVTMYKKNGCPYCARAIELLEGKYQLKINYVDIESENRFVYFLLQNYYNNY